MTVHLQAKRLQLLFISKYRWLLRELSQYYGTYQKSIVGKCVDKTKKILIVSNTDIATYLILFNISRLNSDYNFSLVCKLLQHLDL